MIWSNGQFNFNFNFNLREQDCLIEKPLLNTGGLDLCRSQVLSAQTEWRLGALEKARGCFQWSSRFRVADKKGSGISKNVSVCGICGNEFHLVCCPEDSQSSEMCYNWRYQIKDSLWLAQNETVAALEGCPTSRIHTLTCHGHGETMGNQAVSKVVTALVPRPSKSEGKDLWKAVKRIFSFADGHFSESPFICFLRTAALPRVSPLVPSNNPGRHINDKRLGAKSRAEMLRQQILRGSQESIKGKTVFKTVFMIVYFLLFPLITKPIQKLIKNMFSQVFGGSDCPARQHRLSPAECTRPWQRLSWFWAH